MLGTAGILPGDTSSKALILSHSPSGWDYDVVTHLQYSTQFTPRPSNLSCSTPAHSPGCQDGSGDCGGEVGLWHAGRRRSGGFFFFWGGCDVPPKSLRTGDRLMLGTAGMLPGDTSSKALILSHSPNGCDYALYGVLIWYRSTDDGLWRPETPISCRRRLPHMPNDIFQGIAL